MSGSSGVFAGSFDVDEPADPGFQNSSISFHQTGPARSFHSGKRLVFRIAWNGIPVGYVTAESGDVFVYRNREVYTLKLVTESNKFLSTIYRVEDTFISYVATDTMSSMRYEADRKEGRYRKHVIVEYDFENMEAVYTSVTDGSIKRSPIYEDPHDLVSAICYFMTLPVRSGDSLDIVLNLNEKNYIVNVNAGEMKKIKVPALGVRDGLRVTPVAKLDGVEVAKGKAWAYVSADEDGYPLYGAVRIPFGTVTATLVRVESL